MQFGGEKGEGWLEEGSLETLHSSSHMTDGNEPRKARWLGQADTSGSLASAVAACTSLSCPGTRNCSLSPGCCLRLSSLSPDSLQHLGTDLAHLSCPRFRPLSTGLGLYADLLPQKSCPHSSELV